MYKILEIEDKVRVPPLKFGMPTKEAIKSSLEDKWEGVVNRKFGVVLGVLGIGEVGEGKILPEDGAIHYPSKFSLVVYHPDQLELVRGEVIDVTEFGAFLRIGPVDAMIHVGQLMNDFVSYDDKNNIFTGRDSKRKLKVGDKMVSRITSVSMERNQYKLGLTARQPGLGALDWIEEDKKQAKKPAAGGPAKPAAGGPAKPAAGGPAKPAAKKPPAKKPTGKKK